MNKEIIFSKYDKNNSIEIEIQNLNENFHIGTFTKLSKIYNYKIFPVFFYLIQVHLLFFVI